MDLTSTDEHQELSCQTTGFDRFSPQNITECENHVRSIQRKLDRAVADDDKAKIRWHVHLLSKKSLAVKILAVYRICEINKGRHTAGVDGMKMPRDRTERKTLMNKLVDNIDITSMPSPIRRTYIPKPNGDKRPLGIPTIKDRIIQEIIRQSIEPICEYHFIHCSHGFRPKRSCHDASTDLFGKLALKTSRRWIIEGDIKGCFDHIKHDHVISTLQKWDIPEPITQIIEGMLKADIMKDLSLTPSDEGTPQGGVISPMLANVALTCLDEEIRDRFGVKKMNPIVRYADDFVITAISRNHAEHIKSHIKAFLKAEIGLQLSDEKTHITEISEGFNFLGFNYRKYGEKLLIKPAKDNVLKVRRNIRETFKTTDSLVGLISKLNPIITGWGNYYRHVISKSIFGIIDQEVYEMTMTWLRNKHGRKSAIQMRRYFRTVGKDTINLHDEDTGITLLKMKKIPIKRFVKVKDGMRVYDSNAIEYWKKREYTNARNSIYGSYNLTTLFRQQKGRCGYCSQPITDEQVREATIHTHHLRPRSEGGDDKLGNLKLVHAKCHISLHSQVSRNDMARYISNGIDYLRLIKPAKR